MSVKTATSLLELEIEEGPPAGCAEVAPPAGVMTGVVVGTLNALSAGGQPVVCFRDDAGRMLQAVGRTTVALATSDAGREVVLQFERGDPSKPIILGLLREVVPAAADDTRGAGPSAEPSAEIDAETVRLASRQQLVLRCGEASITLTSAGKVLIRGTYIDSRSSGVNRIKGGSVQIN
jgi:hypothetical protein